MWLCIMGSMGHPEKHSWRYITSSDPYICLCGSSRKASSLAVPRVGYMVIMDEQILIQLQNLIIREHNCNQGIPPPLSLMHA